MDNSQEKIRIELDSAIKELKNQGINYDSKEETIVGLGDIIEATLTRLGITQERFKEFFGLRECNCTERKKFLNNLFSWKVNK